MIQFYCLVLKTKWPKSRPHIWIQPCLHCWFNLNIFHYSYLIVTYLKLFLSFIKNYDYHCWMSSLAVSFLGTFPQMLESCFCVSLQSTLSPSLFFSLRVNFNLFIFKHSSLPWKHFGKLHLFWLPPQTSDAIIQFRTVRLSPYFLRRGAGFSLTTSSPLPLLHLDVSVFPYIEKWRRNSMQIACKLYGECTRLRAKQVGMHIS